MEWQKFLDEMPKPKNFVETRDKIAAFCGCHAAAPDGRRVVLVTSGGTTGMSTRHL